MNLLKKFTDSTTAKAKTETADKSAPASEEGSLLSSAKVVADAARSTVQNEPTEKKHDNAEVAGAAADLLDAGQTYGKLDKTSGVGSYVDKAENYLREYETSHSTKPKASEEPKPSSEKEEEEVESAKPTSDEPKPEKLEDQEPKAAPEKEEIKEPVTSEEAEPTREKEVVEEPGSESAPEPTTKEEPKEEEEKSESAKPTTDSEEKTSGLGDYAKAAAGFLKKDGESAEGEKGESGGIGQYAKVAEGFLDKPSDSEGSKTDGGDLLKAAGGFLGKN